MDKADIELRPGFRKRVHARDVENGTYNRYGRYFCPLCKEPVTPRIGDIRQAHFAHEKDATEIARRCDAFHENNSGNSDHTYNYYTYNREKIGLPFYLENLGDKFELSLGIPKLTYEMLQRCQRDAIKISGTTWSDTIPCTNLQPDKISFQPIGCVCNEYRIEYPSILRTKLNCGKYTDRGIIIPGINNGMFFHVRSRLSRKVAFQGNIYCDTEYYYLTKKTHSWPKGIECLEEFPLRTADANWFVYKLIIHGFGKRIREFVEEHNLFLSEKPGEFIVLWPPTVQKYSVRDDDKEKKILNIRPPVKSRVFCVLQSPLHKKNELLSFTKWNKFFRKIKIDNYDNVVSTDFIQQNISRTYHPPVYSVQQPEMSIENNSVELPLPDAKSRIEITCNMLCTTLQTNRGIPKASWDGRKGLSIWLPGRNIQNGDAVQILHGLDSIFVCSFQSPNQEKTAYHSTLSDDEMYLKLVKSKGKFIMFPVKLKYIALSLTKYPKTTEYIRRSMKQGKIREDAADSLLKKRIMEI